MNNTNNVTIANFMGHSVVDTKFTYHKSWDALMPVVSECRVSSNDEDSHWENIYYSLSECDINVTYNAVLDFIVESNSNK